MSIPSSLSNDKHTLNSNQLSYSDDDTPYCKRFNDIYFDSQSGYQQSDEIFIQANKLTARIKQSKTELIIAETGFGTGLNFLLTLQAYQKARKSSECCLAPIHFISVEKYPLSKAQLIKSLSILPQLKEFATLLTSQYPPSPVEKFPSMFQTSFFSQQVKLSIIFADASQGFKKISRLNNQKHSNAILNISGVDIWYLDGFSPNKNPDMWSDEVFQQIGRLSKEQSSLTTFTVAGFVKRKLRAIGFRLEKMPIQGNKKEMLRGIFQQAPTSGKGYQLRPSITKPQHVSIIGGGIASACATLALVKQGIRVTLYCKDQELSQGGSSNAIGAIYPLLHQTKDDISLFYQQAFWRAKALYQSLYQQGYKFSHDWCGLLEIAYKEALVKRKQAFDKKGCWPKDLIRSVDANEASILSGLHQEHGGLFMPKTGWAAPQELVQQIFAAAKASGYLKIQRNIHVSDMTKKAHNNHWLLKTNKGEFTASVLVICGGADALGLNITKTLPLTATRGQVTSMKTNASISKLSTVICHKGYLTPKSKGIHCIGATFQKNQTNTVPTREDDEYNVNMLNKCLPSLAKSINWKTSDIYSSKARLRCMSQDHMPLVGPMPDITEHIQSYPHLAKDKNWPYNKPTPVIDNLYVLTGLGARGLCSAPLLADILAADLCNKPYPVDNHMLFNLSPNRFIIRDIIKRKV